MWIFRMIKGKNKKRFSFTASLGLVNKAHVNIIIIDDAFIIKTNL